MCNLTLAARPDLPSDRPEDQTRDHSICNNLSIGLIILSIQDGRRRRRRLRHIAKDDDDDKESFL